MNPTKANDREDDNNNDKKPAASPAPQVEKLKNANKDDDKKGPTDKDYLIGKGQRISKNPGNVKMREMALAKANEFQAAGADGKMAIARGIAQDLKADGVRFFRKDENSEWTEVPADDLEVVKKIRQKCYHNKFEDQEASKSLQGEESGEALVLSYMLKIFNEKERAEEKWYESNEGKPSNEDLIPLLAQNAETRRAAFALLQQNQKAATSYKKKKHNKTPRDKSDKSDKTTARPHQKQKMVHESPIAAAAVRIQAPATPVSVKEATTMEKTQIKAPIGAATVPAQDPSTPAATPKTLAMVGTTPNTANPTPLELGRGVATVSPAFSMAEGETPNIAAAAAVNALPPPAFCLPPDPKGDYFNLRRAWKKPVLGSAPEFSQTYSPKKTSAFGHFRSSSDADSYSLNSWNLTYSPTKTSPTATTFCPLLPTTLEIDLMSTPGGLSLSASNDSLMEGCLLDGSPRQIELEPASYRNHH